GTVALNDIVTQFAEDHVVGRAAGNIVVAERAGERNIALVEDTDEVIAPRAVAARVELGVAVRLILAGRGRGHAVEEGARQILEALAGEVAQVRRAIQR